MKPIEFKEQNCVYAEDQPEYQPLPANRAEDGTVVSCWKLTEKEIETISKTGILYISLLTFNQPLQPLLPSVDNPLIEKLCFNCRHEAHNNGLGYYTHDPCFRCLGFNEWESIE